VLIVDHNLAFQRAAERLLQQGGDVVVVRVVDTGEQALACAAELRPDVVLFDLGMPDLSRLTTISRLRGVLPQAGIIALTSLGSDGHRRVVLTVGADELVGRATASTELLPAVRRVVQARRDAGDGRPVGEAVTGREQIGDSWEERGEETTA
jgi:DNA-binding NarL/FixJ family response regulator